MPSQCSPKIPLPHNPYPLQDSNLFPSQIPSQPSLRPHPSPFLRHFPDHSPPPPPPPLLLPPLSLRPLPRKHPHSSFKLKVAFVGPFLLRHAVSSGDMHSVRSILKRQKSLLSELPQSEALSLLGVASNQSEDMLNLLLQAGLQVHSGAKLDSLDSRGWRDLHVAISNDRTEEVLNLLQGCGGPLLDLRDEEGRTALHLAASRGNLRCAKVLLESGIDKDAKSTDGRTALHLAVANGDRRMVDMLIEMGANPSVPDHHGRSSIHVAREPAHEELLEILECGEAVIAAARRGKLEEVESLLERGGSVRYSDQYGVTALHAAAFKGHKDIVSVLVENGVDLEWRDNEGHAPLHLAVEGGCIDTVEVLINRGANINANTKSGVTPLYLAKAFGFHHISQFLTDRGATFSSPPHALSFPLITS